jgi:Flp pilus assembly pilin Flp
MIKAYVWAQSLRTNGIEALKNESGQDLIEYAVLAGGIGIIAAVAFFAGPLDMAGAMDNFAASIKNCVNLSSTYSCP